MAETKQTQDPAQEGQVNEAGTGPSANGVASNGHSESLVDTAVVYLREREPLGFRRTMPRWWIIAFYVAIMAAAAVLRFWDLDARAMHHDESLHVYYSWELAETSVFRHNPMMHAPLQMILNSVVFRIFGDTDFTGRVMYATLGTITVGMPFFFRARLGNLGAAIVSFMLMVSPSILYYNRFAREDTLMVLFTIGLVIAMWRYFDEGKNRYLYWTAAFLALAFGMKESAYMIAAMFGLYYAIVIAAKNWPSITSGIVADHPTPPAAITRLVGRSWVSIRDGLQFRAPSRATTLLVIYITVTLPLWSAAIAVFQHSPLLEWTGITLAAPVDGTAPIGAPVRGGMVIAAIICVAYLAAGIYFGLKWNRSVWWKAAVIFWVIWAIILTTYFTNLVGIGSGMWQGLGYWIVQQGEARGNQPWYYYIVMTSVYEFLPAILSVIAGIYYLKKRDRFGIFLVYWVVMSFVLYTAASEKMPWLEMHLALPFIVLSGKFLGDVLLRIQWSRLGVAGAVVIGAAVPAGLYAGWRLAFAGMDGTDLPAAAVAGASALVLGTAVALFIVMANRVGYRNAAGYALIPLTIVLMVLTIRASIRVAYLNGDTPIDMMVYTQSSPDLVKLARALPAIDEANGAATANLVTVDINSGFAWPWHWYLRGRNRLEFINYSGKSSIDPPDSAVVLVHSSNNYAVGNNFGDRFTAGERLKHRWWFPENYRGMSIAKFIKSIPDREPWRVAMDYFMSRKLSTPLGSEDAYFYIRPELRHLYGPELK
ncbi:MAG: TIGR03663 family protein [SAR202 cluster bacterium]|nr:TIGR03663 family protein [SAR202 cluster bacterium]